jgi:hypothetical protein
MALASTVHSYRNSELFAAQSMGIFNPIVPGNFLDFFAQIAELVNLMTKPTSLKGFFMKQTFWRFFSKKLHIPVGACGSEVEKYPNTVKI